MWQIFILLTDMIKLKAITKCTFYEFISTKSEHLLNKIMTKYGVFEEELDYALKR